MIQEQLVEYINTQTKLGVSREAIKSTLVGAGWQVADVEDTFKKVDAAKSSQPSVAAAPATTSPLSSPSLSPSSSTVSAFGNPLGVKPAVGSSSTPASMSSPSIKVSDLVSASSDTTMSVMPASTTNAGHASPSKDDGSKSPLTGPTTTSSAAPASVGAKSTMPPIDVKSNTYQSSQYATASHGSRGALITEIVLAILVVAAGGFAGFLYMQNNALTGKIASLQNQSGGVASQVADLQAQIAASTTLYATQVSALGSQNQELQTELSFYAVPPNTSPDQTASTTLSGTVSGGGKSLYIITGTYGAKIYVSNSKDAAVVAALTPIVGATAQFSGNYIPGSDSITLTAVNGTALK